MQYLTYILCLLISTNAFASQTKKPQVSINFTSAKPTTDGDLQDPSLQAEATIDQLTQVWPKVKSANINKSKIKLMYNDEYLLIGAELFNNHTPITANTLQYNQDTTGDDSFTILVDTFDNEQNTYWFSVNPNSVKNDGFIVNNSKNIPEWNGVWYASSKRTDKEWAVEMAIPFKMLTFDPNADAWGLNVIQKIGLDPHGRPIDINTGVRFSGYGDRWRLGLLSVNTESINSKGTQQLTDARGTWLINEHIKSGFMITDGDPSTDVSNQTFCLDFRDHRFLTNKALEVGAWLQSNNTEGINKYDMAWVYQRYIQMTS
ncbi:hypothetical protein [Colwellia sp. MB3u-4]|uniref:hypothetical protein n=1 Tax=Colwellia sp. MB3u-4 TaxID=2759822 RepID=UPI0015F3C4B2|nr:hypothetical protein [Colwellia sp. MB3u-4]MBA6289034.1 hypothetical protein [Colwellia sp. MB3u-4]